MGVDPPPPSYAALPHAGLPPSAAEAEAEALERAVRERTAELKRSQVAVEDMRGLLACSEAEVCCPPRTKVNSFCLFASICVCVCFPQGPSSSPR